jgi:uncharacterized protein (DUF58 family)
MIPSDVLKKIKGIQIKSSRLAANVFAGQYKSVFKGRGLEFYEVRDYLVGDDIRSIDWNITARTGKPHIKKYVEERELTIMLLLDASRSGWFGSSHKLKKEVAAEVSAVLTASANKNNDRVGLIIFTDKIEKFIPPRKGHHHVLRIIREALYYKPQSYGTDIALSLEYLNKVTTRTCVAFLISDFYADGLKKPLALANKRHDIIAVKITDPRDSELPDVGILALNDAESGRRYLINSSKTSVRNAYKEKAGRRSKELNTLLGSLGIDTININTASPYVEPIMQFFKRRKMRRAVRS